MRLEGKVAIVTGGTRGIGEGIVALFAEEGAHVVNGDLKEPDSLPAGNVIWEQLDVTDLDNWQRVVDGVVEAKGTIDMLVNNAGFVGSYEADRQHHARRLGPDRRREPDRRVLRHADRHPRDEEGRPRLDRQRLLDLGGRGRTRRLRVPGQQGSLPRDDQERCDVLRG